MILILNQSICSKIENSNIPEDCKKFYIALTILESSWHKNKNAVKKNNYSGFKYRNKLKIFSSEKAYVVFFEKWFKRYKIHSEKDFHNHILSGKYAILSKPKIRVYLNNILKIKNKYIKRYDKSGTTAF